MFRFDLTNDLAVFWKDLCKEERRVCNADDGSVTKSNGWKQS